MAPESNTWRDLLGEGRAPKLALIVLGVWLNAADALVTSTIMPSVGRALGDYGLFSWAVAAYLIGAILAGASAGRLSELLGLRRAVTLGAVVFTAGCLLGALAPDMRVFLLGRLIQGVGAGWVVGFAMVAIAVLFPPRHLARVFAVVTGVWGVATVLGPLFGGLLVQGGGWRSVFWAFAAQAAVVCVAAPVLFRGAEVPAAEPDRRGVPWPQLGVLLAAASALALADVSASPWLAGAALVAAAGGLWGLLRLDAHARVRLLPSAAGDLRSPIGSGLAARSAFTAAEVGFGIYAPAVLQAVHGLSPLAAGYTVSGFAVGWVVCGFAVQGVADGRDRGWIRWGAAAITAGAAAVAAVMVTGPAPIPVALAGALMGCGFGLSFALMSRRLLAAAPAGERAVAASAIIAVQQTGGAFGAALAGLAANLAGFSRGLGAANAQAAGVAVAWAALPLALLGLLAAWRMTGRTSDQA